MRLSWLTKIDWKHRLEGEYSEIAELIGIDNFIKLAESFFKLSISFSSVQFERLAREYIISQEEQSTRQLAREIGTSERFVQKIRKEQKSKQKKVAV